MNRIEFIHITDSICVPFNYNHVIKRLLQEWNGQSAQLYLSKSSEIK